MAASKLAYLELTDSGDERGSSFPVPGSWFAEAFPVRDGHITTLLPGQTRGNHFHRTRLETIIVMFDDRWSLHWDEGKHTARQHRQFEGQGAVVLMVQPEASHAIRNDGSRVLRLVGLTDGPFDPTSPDTFPRKVTAP
jgi:dTDP-4-dehydrorhamnose 3,5-epimerase-like enzyme